MMEIIDRIANFAIQTNFGSLPDTSSYYIKHSILDLIGCACAGISTERGRIAIDLSAKLGGPKESSIIGTPHKVSSVNAAFANGELINALDYDAMTAIGKHDVPIIISAALAVAESIKSSPEDLILSVAVGLEISSRLHSGPDRIDPSAQTWPTVLGSSAASIAAAVSVGKLLNLDREKMLNAIGISGNLCPPSTFRKWLETSPVRMIKYGSTGWGAQAAVTAALLAQDGYTGDTELFDGDYGFWRFTGKSEPQNEGIFADLGNNWVWHKVNFKKYPAGGVLSGILNQFIDLIETNDLKPEDVDEITAYAPSIVSFRLFRENNLQTPDDYCFNTLYLLACAAHRIGCSFWQREEVRQDPKIQKFMRSTELRLITDAETPRAIEVIARGQSYLGDPDSMGAFESGKAINSDELAIDKFTDNTSACLSSEERHEIIQGVLNMEKLPDIISLMKLVSS